MTLAELSFEAPLWLKIGLLALCLIAGGLIAWVISRWLS